MSQVPPYQAVIMSKAILFWRRVFLIRDIPVFCKDTVCRLLFKAFWVQVVRASVCVL